jgi:hypothetical protein
MNKHKTKLFKKVFEENADDLVTLNGPKIHVLTEETFVPLMGHMWDKVKARYKKRYKQKSLAFVEWVAKKYTLYGDEYKWQIRYNSGLLNKEKGKTTEELYELWKNRETR